MVLALTTLANDNTEVVRYARHWVLYAKDFAERAEEVYSYGTRIHQPPRKFATVEWFMMMMIVLSYDDNNGDGIEGLLSRLQSAMHRISKADRLIDKLGTAAFRSNKQLKW